MSKKPGAVIKQYWVPNAEKAYTIAEVDPSNEKQVVCTATGKKFPIEKAQAANPADMYGAPDNTSLMYLNEPGMLENLRTRYNKDQIYTYTGFILIAVNPYKLMKQIYSKEVMLDYTGKSMTALPPHVFAVADRVLRMMKSEKMDQSVLISGESGAGKTETAKLVMRYLVNIAGRPGADEASTGSVEARILATNPLLESFGNAKTPRNNNSSRFGKYILLNFNKQHIVIGASMEVYLLEKSRLPFQAPNNRNYHSFYQLMSQASPEEQKKYHTLAPEKFFYLSQGGDWKISEEPWTLADVKKAMSAIGLSEEEKDNIFRIVSGVAHIGNVGFRTQGKSDDALIVPSDHLNWAAEMFGVEPARLGEVLVSRSISSGSKRGSKFKIPLKLAEAVYGRDALAKSVYNHLFLWLVDRCNVSLHDEVKEPTASSIGILDIFGFEYFDNNSFEQLCINFCNEKLQQQFNQCIFKQELEIYAREAIISPKVNYIDNQDCIDLFETPATGLIAILDEQCRLPKATDKSFAEAVYFKQGKHKRLAEPTAGRAALAAGGKRSQLNKTEAFVIRHYAADVCYNVAGFLDKNNDSIHEDLEMILTTSKNALLKKMFEGEVKDSSKAQGATGGRFKSVSSQFAKQLRNLITNLNKTTCNFIRCIKPNDAQKPGIFNPLSIVDQLRCNGMFDALTLMHEGYPTRCPYSDLYDRFAPMMPKEIQSLKPAYFCEALIMALECERSDFQLGLTRLFFRSGKLGFLEDLRGEGGRKVDAALVEKIKKYLARKTWRKIIYSGIANLRFHQRVEKIRAFKQFRQVSGILTIMASTWIRAARRVRSQRAAAKVQALIRMHQQRRVFKRKANAIVTIQRYVRGYLARKRHGAKVKQALQKARSDPARLEAAREVISNLRKGDEEMRRIRAEEARAREEEKQRKVREAEEREMRLREQAERERVLAVIETDERAIAIIQGKISSAVESALAQKNAEIEQVYAVKLREAEAELKRVEEELAKRSALSEDEAKQKEEALHNLEKEVDSLKHEQKEARREYSDLKRAKEELASEVNVQKKEKANLERDKEDARKRVEEAAEQLAQAREEIRNLQAQAEKEKRTLLGDMQKANTEKTLSEAKILEQQNQLKRMEAEIQSLHTRVAQEQSLAQKYKQDAANIQHELEEKMDELAQELDDSAIGQTRAMAKLREDLSNLTSERDQLVFDKSAMADQLKDAQAKAEAATKNLVTVRRQLEQELEEQTQKAHSLTVEKSVVDMKLEALKAEVERLRAEIERLRKERDLLGADKAELENKLALLQQKNDKLERQISKMRANAGDGAVDSPDRNGPQVAALRAKVEELRAEAEVFRRTSNDQRNRLQDQLDEKDEEAHQLSVQNKILNLKVGDYERSLEDIRKTVRDLNNRLDEEIAERAKDQQNFLAQKAELEARLDAAGVERTPTKRGPTDRALNHQVAMLEQEKSDLVLENQLLNDRIESLQGKLADAQIQLSEALNTRERGAGKTRDPKTEQLAVEKSHLESQLGDKTRQAREAQEQLSRSRALLEHTMTEHSREGSEYQQRLAQLETLNNLLRDEADEARHEATTAEKKARNADLAVAQEKKRSAEERARMQAKMSELQEVLQRSFEQQQRMAQKQAALGEGEEDKIIKENRKLFIENLVLQGKLRDLEAGLAGVSQNLAEVPAPEPAHDPTNSNISGQISSLHSRLEDLLESCRLAYDAAAEEDGASYRDVFVEQVTKENDALRKRLASIEMPFVSHRGVQTEASASAPSASRGVETGDGDDGAGKGAGDDVDRDAILRDVRLQQLQQQAALQEKWNEELRQQLLARDDDERRLKELLLARLKVMEDELRRLMADQFANGTGSGSADDQMNTRDLLLRVEELDAIIRRSLGQTVDDPKPAQVVPRSTSEIIRGEPVPGMPGFNRPAPGQGYDDDDIIIGPALPSDVDSAPRIYYLHTERNKAKIPLPPAPQTPRRLPVAGTPTPSILGAPIPQPGGLGPSGSFIAANYPSISRNW